MIGFLVTGALAGLGALAWPLYLHLFRHRKPRVVTVPSLVLFSQEKRRNRRRRVSDLLLLLARLLIFAALCLLVARPYVRTRWQLPLPSLSQNRRILAVAVDTGLRAMSADEQQRRFDYQRAWLRQHLSGLPQEVAVAVVSTAQPMTAPLLSADEAIALIDAMEPVPVTGSASEAVRVLQEQTEGIPTLFCVAASRDPDLWNDESQEAAIVLLDTSEVAPPRGIRRIEQDAADPRSLDCELFGFPPDGALPQLALLGADGSDTPRPVTAQELLQGRLRIELSGPAGSEPVEVDVADGYGPWRTWHLVARRQAVRRDEVWLVADSSPASQVAKGLVVAALQAVRPGARLRVLAAGDLRSLAGEPAPSQLVLLSLAAPETDVTECVERVLARGGRASVFCAPDGGPLPGLVTWLGTSADGERSLVPGDAAEGWLPMTELELSGLADVQAPRVRPPELGEGAVPLVTAAGVPAVVGKRLGEGQLVCVGIPLDLASDSPVFHPLFPHLIAGVTCVAEIAGGEQGHVVGESPTVGDLFGVKEFAGDVLVPGGDPRPVSRPDTRLFLDRPGTWRLAGGGGSVAVNMPRPLALPTPSRDEWLARHGSFDVTWADDNTDLGDLALYVRTGRRERTYDASSVAALLLLLGLLGEASLRVLGARRRGAVDA